MRKVVLLTMLMLVMGISGAMAVIQPALLDGSEPVEAVIGARAASPAGKKIAAKTEAYAQVDLDNAFRMGADAFLKWQHTDGGWQWYYCADEAASTSTASAYNCFGVTGRVLPLLDQRIPEVDYIGDGTYPGGMLTAEHLAARDADIYISSGDSWNYMFGPDYIMLIEISEITGDYDYATSAAAYWAKMKAGKPGFGTGVELAERAAESWMPPGYFAAGYGYSYGLWNLAPYVAAAERLGDHAYAQACMDTIIAEHTYPVPPGDPRWNDGYMTTNIFQNFIKRIDDFDLPTSGAVNQDYESFWIGAFGNLMWAMNEIDGTRYASEIQQMVTRLDAVQIKNVADPDYGGFEYADYGWGVDVQDTGYAMMGLRNIGEVQMGQKATEWAIDHQWDTGDDTKGFWTYDDGSCGSGYRVYTESCSELLQGMWDVAEGETRPWVQVTISPQGSHVNQVPFSFKVFDLGSNPATVMIEWTRDGGVTWTETDRVTGAVNGLPTSPSGVEHALVWNSFPEIPASPPAMAQANCKIRITARDDSTPGAWGSPAGLTTEFTVDNTTIPVELSIFNLE